MRFLNRLGFVFLAVAGAAGPVRAAAFVDHAVEWSGGVLKDLGPGLPGANGSVAFSVNNAGDAVGASDVGLTSYAVKWSGGSVINLGLPVGAVGASAFAINIAGDAAGESFDQFGNLSAVEWTGAGPIALSGLPGAVSTVAVAINDAGEAVGYSLFADNSERAIAWFNGGPPTDLGGVPGAIVSVAVGVNNLGQAVGLSCSADPAGFCGNVEWTAGSIVQLPALPQGFGDAVAINDSGDIAGDAPGPGGAGATAVEWTAGTIHDLGLPLAPTQSLADSINSGGDIVGFYQPGGQPFAAEWKSGVFAALAEPPGLIRSYAYDINDSGLIVGEALYAAVPEPATWMMGLLGFGGLALAGRRLLKSA